MLQMPIAPSVMLYNLVGSMAINDFPPTWSTIEIDMLIFALDVFYEKIINIFITISRSVARGLEYPQSEAQTSLEPPNEM